MVLQQYAENIMEGASEQRESLKSNGNKKDAYRVRKKRLTFWRHIIRKDGIENLILTIRNESKRGIMKQ